jgi:hypothetical protein
LKRNRLELENISKTDFKICLTGAEDIKKKYFEVLF